MLKKVLIIGLLLISQLILPINAEEEPTKSNRIICIGEDCDQGL